MKKIFLSTAFAMGVMVATAQSSGETTADNTTRISKADKKYLSSVSTNDDIRQLATQMQLNEGQYIRLRDLTRAKNQQLKEINNMYANDPSMRQSKMAAANEEFEKQLAQSVSQSQFTAYMASQGRAPEPMPGSINQAAGYGGRSLESGAATGTSTNGGAVNTDDASTNPSQVNMEKDNSQKEYKSDNVMDDGTGKTKESPKGKVKMKKEKME